MYKAFIDGELSLPVSAKNSYLSASGYYLDSTDDLDDAENEGFTKRKARAALSKTMQFITKLDVDIFTIDQSTCLAFIGYLINNTP